jgi:hypothetical protein
MWESKRSKKQKEYQLFNCGGDTPSKEVYTDSIGKAVIIIMPTVCQ